VDSHPTAHSLGGGLP
jgi:hypothetical protein